MQALPWNWHKVAASVGLPLAVTLLGYLPADWISHSTLLMLYLMVVLFCAILYDWLWVLNSAFLGFLLFNFFHTQPRYTLLMHDLTELSAALVYIFFALLAGGLAHRLRTQVVQLQFQERFLTAQLEMLNAQAIEGEPETIDFLLAQFSDRVFGSQVQLELSPQQPDPLTGAKAIQVHTSSSRPLAKSWITLIRGLGEQLQAALDRQSADAKLQEARRRADEEGLRNALLSSVSHDLKTPLATMLGSATTLRELQDDLSENDRLELLDSIIDESRRLERYIQNLLDMTRLGHGELSLNRQWISIEELYHVVMRRLERSGQQARVDLEVLHDLPPLWLHAALIEQALFNAIENALKASPPTKPVVIRASETDNTVFIDVCDHGSGIPEAEWESVFAQFYSFSRGDRYSAGSGLGLTICRGMLRVHGGDAYIVPPPPGFGHCLRLTLPITEALTAGETGDNHSDD